MIFPARLLAMLLVAPAVASFALYTAPGFWPVVVVLDALALALALVDALTLPWRSRLRVTRECQPVASLGERHEVTLEIENRGGRAVRLEIRDDVRPGLERDPIEESVTVPSMSRVRLKGIITPVRRGRFDLEHVWVRGRSLLGLWQVQLRFDAPTELRVYPALAQIGRYALYARMSRLSLLGVRQSRRIGTDNEFERLREYTHDDQFKTIDWRATARRNKPIVRDFQSSHNQRVILMLDAGRMMMAESGGLTVFDRALDAALTLAHIVISKGDSAGLLIFSDRIHRWLEPKGGRRHLSRMVHAAHDVHPDLVESRYDEAFLHIHRRCRKRTLIILITNLIDELNASQVRGQMLNLAGRHLPMGVFLRDRELFDPVERFAEIDEVSAGDRGPSGARRASQPGPSGTRPGAASLSEAEDLKRPWRGDDETLFKAAAASDILEWRRGVLNDLRHQGALVLDLFPEDLTAPLINEYLRIKSRQLL